MEEVRLFPSAYQEYNNKRKSEKLDEIDQKKREELRKIDQRYAPEMNKIWSERKNFRPPIIASSKFRDIFGNKIMYYLLMITGLGLTVSLFACTGCFICDGMDIEVDSTWEFWNHVFFGCLIAIGMLFVIAFILDLMDKKEKDTIQKINEETDVKIKALTESKNREYAIVEDKYIGIVNDCEEQFRKEMIAYEKQFDEKSTQLAAGLMDSDLIRRFAYVVSTTMKKKIDSAEREAFRELVEVDLKFCVYRDKIQIDDEKPIDFVVARVELIEDPIKIYAVAKAIALQSRLLIEEAYPESPSGTVPEVDYVTEIETDYAMVKMNYREPNGNYKAIRRF